MNRSFQELSPLNVSRETKLVGSGIVDMMANLTNGIEPIVA